MNGAHIVMPAAAGIHDFAACINGKSWMPIPAFARGKLFVGMTGNGERRVNLSAGWYKSPRQWA
jgi:hypothetical protein